MRVNPSNIAHWEMRINPGGHYMTCVHIVCSMHGIFCTSNTASQLPCGNITIQEMYLEEEKKKNMGGENNVSVGK